MIGNSHRKYTQDIIDMFIIAQNMRTYNAGSRKLSLLTTMEKLCKLIKL